MYINNSSVGEAGVSNPNSMTFYTRVVLKVLIHQDFAKFHVMKLLRPCSHGSLKKANKTAVAEFVRYPIPAYKKSFTTQQGSLRSKLHFPPPPPSDTTFFPMTRYSPRSFSSRHLCCLYFLFILHLFYSCNFNFPLIFPLSSFFTFSPFFSTLFHISPSSNNISQYFPPRPGGGGGEGDISIHIHCTFSGC